MKVASLLTLGLLMLAACAPQAQGPSYIVGDDSGFYTLPSGSKLACGTSEYSAEDKAGGAVDTAFCTMKLAPGDSADLFPTTIQRFGKTFVVKDGCPDNCAWTDCGDNCIHHR